jgi:hypothetical protein
MMRSPKAFVLLAAAFILSTASLYPQGFSPKKIWNLTIAVNVPGAQVWVDNVALPGNTTTVTGGAHNVRVQADGYYDFVGPVVVGGHMTFTVNLQPRGFPLTIRTNAPNAAIFVDGAEVTGTVPVVAGGNHTVQVSAPGFTDYSAVVAVNGPMTLDVSLRGRAPAGIPFTVTSNVPDAVVSVNGVMKGGIPYSELLPRGRYQVRVTANGYGDYNATVILDKPFALDAQLQRSGLLLTVNGNVPNATVEINGEMRGRIPYAERLPAGAYIVRVTAPGFADYNARVNLDKPITMNVQLQPQLPPPVLSITIPPAFLDPDSRQGDRDGQVRVFVDDRMVQRREMGHIEVAPGRHVVRVSSGALSVQLADFDFQPGMTYAIELSMDLKVRGVRSTQP